MLVERLDGFYLTAPTGLVQGVAAQGTLTVDTQITNGDTMTVDTKTYTFQDTLTDVDGNIKIGATLAATQANLVAAFDLSGIAGTDYAASMTAHPTVNIADFAADAAVLTAKTKGTAGNSIATTETFTAGTNIFDAATPKRVPENLERRHRRHLHPLIRRAGTHRQHRLQRDRGHHQNPSRIPLQHHRRIRHRLRDSPRPVDRGVREPREPRRGAHHRR
jgi:hypothetical protein